MHYNQLRLIALLLTVLFFGCDSFDEEEPIPSYVEINSFKLTHENALGISDVWVYIENDLVGAFVLPARIPILDEGEKRISISAGIKVNGIGASRSYYPFYTPYETKLNLKPGEVIEIDPIASYQDWSYFPFEENFEGGAILLENLEASDTSIIITQDETFEGQFAGVAFVDTARNFFGVTCIDELTRPDFVGTPGIFLEMNYKGDNEIVTGIFIDNGINSLQELVILRSTEQWKKAYIDLYQVLSPYPKGTAYKIFIGTQLPEGKLKGSIYLDDLKVVQSKQQ